MLHRLANYAGHFINRLKYFSSLMFDAMYPCLCAKHLGTLDTHADRRQLLSSLYVEIPGQELFTGYLPSSRGWAVKNRQFFMCPPRFYL